MDINQAISGRRSVREYASQPVDEKTIRHLIDAAVVAPSAVNQQPWCFTVVRDQTLLDRISREAKAHMLATTPPDAQSAHFKPILSDPNFQIFYHAPVLILISAQSPGPWIVEDCALAAQNLMLTAYAAGLGSCWIGFAQSFLNSAEGKKIAGLAPEAPKRTFRPCPTVKARPAPAKERRSPSGLTHGTGGTLIDIISWQTEPRTWSSRP
jgi:nitroreductase